MRRFRSSAPRQACRYRTRAGCLCCRRRGAIGRSHEMPAMKQVMKKSYESSRTLILLANPVFREMFPHLYLIRAKKRRCDPHFVRKKASFSRDVPHFLGSPTVSMLLVVGVI